MSEQRILVVEDHPSLLFGIREILDAEGFTVFTASDGMQALEVMEEANPDLILADILMPRMNGYAFYEMVHARPEWQEIPFIFLTAKAEKEDIQRGRELGVEDYITKPFDPDDLIEAVRTKLQGG